MGFTLGKLQWEDGGSGDGPTAGVWSTYTDSGAATRKVYVDSSRPDDTGDGLSESTAKKTIAAGLALIRTGNPDWLLIKKGSEFVNEFIDLQFHSGLSADERLIITTYGTGARPIIRYDGNVATTNLLYTGNTRNNGYIGVFGLDFYNSGRDPNHADFDIANEDTNIVFGDTHHLVLEDCRLRNLGESSLVIGWSHHDVYIRHCQFGKLLWIDSYNGITGNNNCLYCEDGAGDAQPLTIDGNFFYRMYDETGTYTDDGTGPGLHHHLYLHSDLPYTYIRGNLCAFDLGGSQVRAGGQVLNNTFADANYAHNIDGVQAAPNDVSYNCYVHMHEPLFDPTHSIADIVQINGGVDTVVDRNIVAHIDLSDPITSTDSDYKAFKLRHPEVGYTLTNCTVSNNVIYNLEGCDGAFEDNAPGEVTYTNNTVDLTGASPGAFTDASRTLDSYAVTLGLADRIEFYDAVWDMHKGTYDSRYTAHAFNEYLRTGFDVDLLGGKSIAADGGSFTFTGAATDLFLRVGNVMKVRLRHRKK